MTDYCDAIFFVFFAVHTQYQSPGSSRLSCQLGDPKRSFHSKACSETDFPLYGMKPSCMTTQWRDSASDIVDSRDKESPDKAEAMRDGFKHLDLVSVECDSTTPKPFKLRTSSLPGMKKKKKMKSFMTKPPAREAADSFESSDEEDEMHFGERSSVSTVLLQPKQGMKHLWASERLGSTCAACVHVQEHRCRNT